MAEFELRENSFNIFENNFKENSKQPDMKGVFLQNGKKKEISLWRKETKAGKLFYSGTIQDAWEPKEKKVSKDKATPFTDMDDDVPFN